MGKGYLTVIFCFGLAVADEVALGPLDEVTYRYVGKVLLKPHTWDEEMWRNTGNGGYVLRFSLDFDGDGKSEYFLSGTRNMEKTRGSWTLFSGKREIGQLGLSSSSILLVRKDDGVHFLYGFDIDARTATWTDQIVDGAGVSVLESEGTPDQLSALREAWETEGERVIPEVEVLLLSDYVRGSREWRKLDLNGERIGFRGDGRLFLKGDELKLSDPGFTPELARELLSKRPEKLWISSSRRPEKSSLTPRHSSSVMTPGSATGTGRGTTMALALAMGLFGIGAIVWLRRRAPRR